MTLRVITLEREYGSGGGVIAAEVAKRLGWKLWDQSLTEEIARRMDCDCRAVEEHEEKRDPVYYRLFKAFLRGSYEGSQNAPRLKMVDTECVRDVVQKILPQIADAGNCVIVGRGVGLLSRRPRRRLSRFHLRSLSGKGPPAASRKAKARRKRSNWPRRWTATARTSSSDISTSTGLEGIAST